MRSEDFEPKLIYLVKRNARLSREQFVERWRQHGKLGMSLPRWKNIAHYVHCDVLRPETSAPELAVEYDGVGLIWHRSQQARAAHVADQSSRSIMERDEFDTFSEPITSSCLVAREIVLQACEPARSAPAKIIFFIGTNTGETREDLVDRRIEQGARLITSLACAGITVRGRTINRPLPAVDSAGWGLKFDCVDEWWFENESSALLAVPALSTASRSERIVWVLTNEIVLYALDSADRPNKRAGRL